MARSKTVGSLDEVNSNVFQSTMPVARLSTSQEKSRRGQATSGF
jgi:hypothetical protein